MPKYTVRVNVEFSSTICADSPEQAINEAPTLPPYGDWDERAASSYEAEEEK